MKMSHLVFLSELRHPIVNSLECLRKQDLWLADDFLTNKALNSGKKKFFIFQHLHHLSTTAMTMMTEATSLVGKRC